MDRRPCPKGDAASEHTACIYTRLERSHFSVRGALGSQAFPQISFVFWAMLVGLLKKLVLGETLGVSRPDVPPSTPPSGTKGEVLGLAP